MSFTREELELIEELKKYRNQKHLQSTDQNLYNGLKYNRIPLVNGPLLLDIALPVLNSATLREEKLLFLAKNGHKRPKCGRGKDGSLGNALTGYTTDSSRAYRPEFNKKIRKVRPDWFISSADRAKEEIISIAISEGRKPSQGDGNSTLGERLDSYCNKKRNTFDVNFFDKLKKIRPDWFIDTVSENKNEIIEIAQSGAKKIPTKSKLGVSLLRYISLTSNSYDEKFKKQIYKLRPDWFDGSSICKKIQNMDTGVVYKSLKEAKLSITFGQSNIHTAAKRGWKCGGFRWAYVD